MASTRVVAGIDIGGTNTAFGLVDSQGTIVGKGTIPTHSQEPAAGLVTRLSETIREMVSGLNGDITLTGAGIGAPNANYHRGTVEYPPNLRWEGVTPVAAMFERELGVKAAITNDANAAALGEGTFGAARGMKDFIVITLGTGLGSGIVANGTLVYGADGFAGEVGHTIYEPQGRFCGCGRRGCLEQYASAPGIVRTVFELLAERRDESELRNISFSHLTAAMVTAAARRNDPIALEAFEVTGRILGFKLADTVAHTSPEAIFLFGGLANAGALIFEPTQRHLEGFLLNIFKNKVKILPSGLHEADAAVLGSAALIWNELSRQGS